MILVFIKLTPVIGDKPIHVRLDSIVGLQERVDRTEIDTISSSWVVKESPDEIMDLMQVALRGLED